ncbi:hypothetical protein LJR289_005694 [Pseudoduganella sp. LjRoot289]|uniref:hypothetical protein n=1 Tax=Pseudoduganella sp. LjRoot289 TaxID=3342314 RepID=UPI003ECE6BED
MKLNLFAAPFAQPLQRAPLQLFALLWLLAMAFTLLEGAGGASDGGVLTLLACGCLLLHCGAQVDALRNAGAAMHRTRMPTAAWPGHVRACLLNISFGWLLLAMAMALRCSLPSSSAMHWTVPGTLLSVMACLGTAIPLRRPGLLPRRLSLVGYAAIAALLAIFIAQAQTGTQAMLDRFGALPLAVLLPLALAWPAMAGLLHLRWRKQPTMHDFADADTGSGSPSCMGLRVRHHLQRYAMLHEGILQTDGSMKPLSAGTRLLFMALVPVMTVLYLRSTWGEQLNGLHFQGLAVICTLCTVGLLMRDLHWRHLLLPGGLRRRGVAFNIYFSTLGVQLSLVLAFGAFIALTDSLHRGQALNEALHKVWLHSLIAPELAFTLSIAVLLKSLGKWGVVAWCTVVVLLSLALFWLDDLVHVPLVRADSAYAASLMLAAFTILLLAQRLWTPGKLQPYLHGRA